MTVAQDSMTTAVQEACDQNDSSRDISISLDGSWQKKGYVSLNGIMTAASMDTGKIVDIEVMSKYCRCPSRLKNQHIENCKANFEGSSGAMEVKGAEAIFQRSIEKYNVR